MKKYIIGISITLVCILAFYISFLFYTNRNLVRLSGYLKYHELGPSFDGKSIVIFSIPNQEKWEETLALFKKRKKKEMSFFDFKDAFWALDKKESFKITYCKVKNARYSCLLEPGYKVISFHDNTTYWIEQIDLKKDTVLNLNDDNAYGWHEISKDTVKQPEQN